MGFLTPGSKPTPFWPMLSNGDGFPPNVVETANWILRDVYTALPGKGTKPKKSPSYECQCNPSLSTSLSKKEVGPLNIKDFEGALDKVGEEEVKTTDKTVTEMEQTLRDQYLSPATGNQPKA